MPSNRGPASQLQWEDTPQTSPKRLRNGLKTPMPSMRASASYHLGRKGRKDRKMSTNYQTWSPSISATKMNQKRNQSKASKQRITHQFHRTSKERSHLQTKDTTTWDINQQIPPMAELISSLLRPKQHRRTRTALTPRAFPLTCVNDVLADAIQITNTDDIYQGHHTTE